MWKSKEKDKFIFSIDDFVTMSEKLPEGRIFPLLTTFLQAICKRE